MRDTGRLFKDLLCGFLSTLSATIVVFAVVTAVTAFAQENDLSSPREPISPLESPVDLDQNKVDLGKKLFTDPILSRRDMLACTSCHALNAGGTVNSRRTIGYDGRVHRFNAPTIFNVANNYRLGWRGDFASLEAQNENVLLDSNLMANDWKTLLWRLEESQTYKVLFQKIYGQAVSREEVLDALATFQRSLVTPAPFDRFLRGDNSAISEDARHGYQLFKDYGCASCHQGSNVGGNMFQKFGIFAEPEPMGQSVNDGDLGRWTITGADRDKWVFRVPSLRNVEVTAPYFHDGRVDTLPEAIAIMARSQLGRDLPPQDVAFIATFLRTLTGEYEGHKLQASPPKDER